MSGDVTFDDRELRQFVANLEKTPASVVPALAAVLTAAAQAVQNDLRAQARGHARFPHFPRSITTDIRGLTAEIGPDKNRRQGALGNILYFGTSRTGPVLPAPGLSLAKVTPMLEDAAAAAVVGSVEDAIGGLTPSDSSGGRARDAAGRFLKAGTEGA